MNICIRILQICLLVMFANGDIDEVHMTCDLDLRENVLGDMCLDIYLKRNDVKGQILAGFLLEAESLYNMTQTQEVWNKTKPLECEETSKIAMLHPLELYSTLAIHRCYKHNTRELFHGCLIRKRALVAKALKRRPQKYIKWMIWPSRFLVEFDGEEINDDEKDLL